jgi:hypothetical protein
MVSLGLTLVKDIDGMIKLKRHSDGAGRAKGLRVGNYSMEGLD